MYNYDDASAWALRFFPTLKFSKGSDGDNEAFYPVDPEGWVSHRADASEVVPPVNNPHHRGTALHRWRAGIPGVTWDNWRSIPPHIGAGNITDDATASGIGSPEFKSQPNKTSVSDPEGDWFLDFGGWSDPAAKTYGQMNYAWKFYTDKVYGALGLPASGAPKEPAPPLNTPPAPANFVPNSSALRASVEFAPLEKVLSELLDVVLPADLAEIEQGQSKIQGLADRLSEFQALTYYLFYPGYVPPDGKLMEGQWEAISLFLKDTGGGNPVAEFASYSQGYRGGIFPMPLAACKAIADMELQGEHPVAYVAQGSHANYFTPRGSEQSVDPGVHWGAALGYGAAGTVAAVGVGLITLGLLSTPVGWPLVLAGLACLFLALLIAVLTWLFTKDDEAPTPPPYDQGARPNDVHEGNGASGGGQAVGTADSPPPAAGSAAADGKVPFVIRVVAPYLDKPDRRGEPPSWWGYAGRWGVCVDDPIAAAASGWGNGTWRRWPDGYTLTHRNVEALVDYLNGEIDRKTNVARSYLKVSG
jgi:hypothetical protein